MKKNYVSPEVFVVVPGRLMDGEISEGDGFLGSQGLNNAKQFLGFYDEEEEQVPSPAEDIEEDVVASDTLYHKPDVWSAW